MGGAEGTIARCPCPSLGPAFLLGRACSCSCCLWGGCASSGELDSSSWPRRLASRAVAWRLLCLFTQQWQYITMWHLQVTAKRVTPWSVSRWDFNLAHKDSYGVTYAAPEPQIWEF